MSLIIWDRSLETGLSDVDQQHRHLVDVTNRFGELLSQDHLRPADTDALLQDLIAYTEYHFDEEEKLMRAIGVDRRHTDLHQQEHQKFFQDVSIIQREWAVKNMISGRDLFDYLVNWLIYHILGCDMNMSRQMDAIRNGRSPEGAYEEQEKALDVSTQTLLKAMKNLFSQVSSRNRELADLNDTLEAKVAARTEELCRANQTLEKLSTTDMLTGLANRRHAMNVLITLWEECPDQPLGCMLIDADYFKEVNDNYGHDAGDTVLRELAVKLQHSVRTDDLVCRLGGDEFLIICPNTDKDGLLHIAQQMHEQISGWSVAFPGGYWQGSVSVGLGVRNADMNRPEDLITVADKGVYAAKDAGKNCVKSG